MGRAKKKRAVTDTEVPTQIKNPELVQEMRRTTIRMYGELQTSFLILVP